MPTSANLCPTLAPCPVACPRWPCAHRAQACLHIYSSNEPATSTESVVDRLVAEAAKRFGEGQVSAVGRSFDVTGTYKAYDLDALRAFD